MLTLMACLISKFIYILVQKIKNTLLINQRIEEK